MKNGYTHQQAGIVEPPGSVVHCRMLNSLIESSPVVPAAEVTEGALQCVEGRARADQLLIAPVTGKHVIGYLLQFELELFDSGEKRCDLVQCADFYAEDSSGQVLVQATDAELVLGHEFSLDSAEVTPWGPTDP